MGTLRVNTLWNLAGQVLPLLAALLTIPSLLQSVGAERFAMLSIAWAVIGYLGVLDLGVSRSITHRLASESANLSHQLVERIAHSGAIILITWSIAISALTLTGLWWWLDGAGVSSGIRDESRAAATILSAAVPVAMLFQVARGVLEGLGHFAFQNAIRAIMGALMFLAPFAVSTYSAAIDDLVLSVAAVRAVAVVLIIILCRAQVGIWPIGKQFSIYMMRELGTFGGWVSVSSLVSPILVYADRFVIGLQLGMSAVSQYVVPFDVLTRALIFPTAAANAVFPRLASSSRKDNQDFSSILSDAVALGTSALLYAFGAGILVVYEVLSIWIGTVSQEMAMVSVVLSIGLVLNAFAHFPYAAVQALGRPNLTAALHVAELPMFFLLVWYLTVEYGVVGTAAAWSIRAGVDLFFLSVILRVIAGRQFLSARGLILPVLMFAGALCTSQLEPPLAIRITIAAVCAVLCVHSFANNFRPGT